MPRAPRRRVAPLVTAVFVIAAGAADAAGLPEESAVGTAPVARRPANADVVRFLEQATIMREQIGFYLDRARAAARAGVLGAATQVAPCLDGLLRAFRKIYADRDVVFTGEAPPEFRFLGERQDLEEMIGNLLDNAGKWAERQVVIAIVAETPASAEARPFLHITIDDDGPGLTPDQIREATQRGRRLDETKPGSGLGLSIVADLAAAYGGALRLEKNSAGGLRASLRVPGF